MMRKSGCLMVAKERGSCTCRKRYRPRGRIRCTGWSINYQVELTLEKHPEEGSEVEISQDYLTDAPNIDDRLIVVGLDKVLKWNMMISTTAIHHIYLNESGKYP